MTGNPSPADLVHLDRAFALARAARDAGDRPFGAVIVGPTGTVIAEAGSHQGSGGGPTAHAEMNALRAAMAAADRGTLARSTLYASTEPCVMCSAAAFYAGISRIVFGLREARLRPIRNQTGRGAGIALSCRDVLARGSRPVSVIGPVEEDQAAALHTGYWGQPT